MQFKCKIKQLVLVGGPSCAGKSFLIQKMRQKDYSCLREQLGIQNPSTWLYVAAGKLAFVEQPVIDQLVVHYDFNAQYSQKNGFKYLRELINISNKVTVLTLYVPSDILIQRVNLRLIKVLKLWVRCNVFRGRNGSFNTRKKILLTWKKRRKYRQGMDVFLYSEWFDFFSQTNIALHWVLDFNRADVAAARLHNAASFDLESLSNRH